MSATFRDQQNTFVAEADPSVHHCITSVMKAEIQTAQDVWPMLAPVVFVPHAESEYQRLVTVLDDLIDVVGEAENYPLAPLMEVIGVPIEKYEEEHVSELTEV